jgi:NTP pyrophosphatase (non-canonical NTP hydrolase)
MKRSDDMVITLMEECGELTQVCSKLLRFGIDSYDPTKPYLGGTRADLIREMGDVVAMITGVAEEYDISDEDIKNAAAQKVNKYAKWSMK